MIVTFRSKAHADIMMFGDVAIQLLKLMGHSGAVPGALQPGDLPDALDRLKKAVTADKATVAAAKSEQGQDDERLEDAKERPVQLAHRALPLIELLEASVAAQCDVMWDQ